MNKNNKEREARRRRIMASLKYPKFPYRRRSLFLRHLDCGSCNACEMELNALSNAVYDMERYGIHFVASPRHADVVLMTGAYTCTLNTAAKAVLDAMPVPRIITIGDCTLGKSIFKDSYATCQIPDEITRVIKGHVSGCPPSPNDILQVLLDISLHD